MFHRNVSAGDLCTRIVSIAFPSQSLEEAAALMRDQHAGSLVVVEEVSAEDRRVVGMLTDRDIVTAVVAERKDPRDLRVADVMSRPVLTAREEDSVLDVLAAMRGRGVRRAPVVGPQNRLIGVIALDDMLEAVAEEMQALAAVVGAVPRRPGAAAP